MGDEIGDRKTPFFSTPENMRERATLSAKAACLETRERQRAPQRHGGLIRMRPDRREVGPLDT
jgi:hypothetical protein